MKGALAAVLLLGLLDGSVGDIGWVSQPVSPGDQILLQGSGFTDTCSYTITPKSSPEKAVTVRGVQSSESSVKVPIPRSMPLDIYALNVSGCPGAAAAVANLPDIWWVQGDQGETASIQEWAEGWVRVFGTSMALFNTSRTSNSALHEAESQKKLLQAAVARGDYAAAARISAKLAEQNVATTSMPTKLRLEKEGEVHTLVSVTSDSSRMWSNTFKLPPSLTASVTGGDYTVAVSNDGGKSWSAMRTFVSPEEPAKTTIRIVKNTHRPSPVTYNVQDYGCCGTVECDSTAAVTAAIAAANRGGKEGRVYFPRGVYYLLDTDTGLPELSPGVSLAGEATDLVSLYMKEQQLNDATPHFTKAPPAYFTFNGTGPNAITDLTIYVTMFYNSVVAVPEEHCGFRMERVRIRANAFHCMNGPRIVGRGNRVANYTWEQVGPVVAVHGKNFFITDCDIYSSYNAIWTSGPTGGRYGLISRNQIWNGGAAHWFDQMKQVVFEENQIVGVSLMAMGNNIDTYGGGYAHHIYHAKNAFQQVWGNDREIMTTDNLGAYYAGDKFDIDGVRITLPSSYNERSGASSRLGGSVALLSGPGAGEYRRIVSWNGSVVTIDRPFAVTPKDGATFMNIGPFRGNFLFHANRYADGGAFQLYSYAMNAVVSEMTMERVGGILSWGRAGPGQYTANLQNQILGNVFVEGNHVYNYNGSYIWPHGKVVEPYTFGVLASDQSDGQLHYKGPLNRFIVFRDNRVLSNGGLVVRGYTADVLAERTVVTNSSVSSDIGPANCQYTPHPGLPREGCAAFTLNSTILIV